MELVQTLAQMTLHRSAAEGQEKEAAKVCDADEDVGREMGEGDTCTAPRCIGKRT